MVFPLPILVMTKQVPKVINRGHVSRPIVESDVFVEVVTSRTLLLAPVLWTGRKLPPELSISQLCVYSGRF